VVSRIGKSPSSFSFSLDRLNPIRGRAIKPHDDKGYCTRVLGKDLEEILILVLFGFQSDHRVGARRWGCRHHSWLPE
jgi:hypothetical protein